MKFLPYNPKGLSGCRNIKHALFILNCMEITGDQNPEELKDTIEVILDSYKARVRIAESIIEDTNNVLNAFANKREVMGDALKGALAKVASLRKKDFDKMMEEITARQIQKEEYVKQVLGDFIEGEKNVVSRLEKLLRKGNGVQIKDFKNILYKIKQDQEAKVKETSILVSEGLLKMQNETSVALTSFQKLREDMTSEWQKVIRTLNEVPKK